MEAPFGFQGPTGTLPQPSILDPSEPKVRPWLPRSDIDPPETRNKHKKNRKGHETIHTRVNPAMKTDKKDP